MKSVFWCLPVALSLACSSSPADDEGAANEDAGSAGQSSNPNAGQSGGGAANAGIAGAGGQLASGGFAGSPGMASNAGGSIGNSGNGGGSGNGGSAGSAPAAEPAIRWLGRVQSTANGARLDWPGTGFSARFDGTGVHVSLKTRADYFEVVVDGQTSVLATTNGTSVYDLAKNLSAGDHTVTLWRRTEPNNGTVEAGPITFDGKLLPPPPSSTKRLEIVGDSISVGFGVECKTSAESFTYATENNYLSYQALTARKFGAEVFTEAWSGIGMWRDVGGGTDAASQMPGRYLHTLPNDTSTIWNFASYVPNAVAVLLGTNDFAKGDPGQPFVDAYTAFVTNLRAHYPAARLYFVVSPMLSGGNRTAITGYLNEIVGKRGAAGDKNVALLAFAPPVAGAWGCGHPNAATHAVMAGVLEDALSKDLGW